MTQAGRAGTYIQQSGNYRAFIPRPLPPAPPLVYDDELLGLLSLADQAVGRLDAASELLPNPDLFVAMYVNKEAVLSSQIEGTQASLNDVLEVQAGVVRKERAGDVGEVVNYVKAMNHGLARLDSLPLSLRLIREIHADLLKNVRGSRRDPGEFRRTKNWIGPSGTSLSQALFVPPPQHEVPKAMGDLENYLHLPAPPPPLLVKAGLAHAQFETIHPFLDGNGRLGRLLITFLLCQWGLLKKPLLYLSLYLKKHRQEYYERLQSVRDLGDWEGWLKFFLRGVAEVAGQASATASAIQRLRNEHLKLMDAIPQGMRLLELMFKMTFITVTLAGNSLGVSYPTARKVIQKFVALGLLQEITSGQRNRVYSYASYLALFQD
ncbi:MAG: Fic family protein [Desulfarculus sp.]|nr:Fic family protein [Desulfarculus sp.]